MGLKLKNSDKFIFEQLNIGDIFTSGQILAMKTKNFSDDIGVYNSIDLSNGTFLTIFEANNVRLVTNNDLFIIV